jgi:hypothetical protein
MLNGVGEKGKGIKKQPSWIGSHAREIQHSIRNF